MHMKILSSAGTSISRMVCWEQNMCLCKPYVEYELSINEFQTGNIYLQVLLSIYSTKVTIQVIATEASAYQSRE